MNKPINEWDRFNLSEEYWNRLDDKSQQIYKKVRPLRRAAYKVNISLARIEESIADLASDAQAMGGQMSLSPDFQRGHVWDQAKRVAYVENLFRGTAPTLIRMNCAGWNSKTPGGGDLNPADIVCVDGLQRLTALREFMKDEFKIFDQYLASDLKGTPFAPSRMTSWTIELEVFDIASRAELLQFYIDINRGGVVHTDEEIDRVRGLLAQTRSAADSEPSKPRKGQGRR